MPDKTPENGRKNVRYNAGENARKNAAWNAGCNAR
jgi:hypothetical protein